MLIVCSAGLNMCCGWHQHVALIHSAYPLVVLTSTLLISVASIILAKLYRSRLLGPHLAPGLTFIGNMTPGQSERVSQREQGENKHARSF